ncbi:MAG: plasmid pRiA4b ORF-3 family protein [Prolixibacteraceae bacterium]|jgi:hypothetical protein|nr:plasmid pRiA4b ORF-3 family protein [Prolixibacteraceae bacterium]
MFIQLKITLKNVKPVVWRRIVVSDELSFFQLHNVLQISFNWTNMHLYSFNIAGYHVETEKGLMPGESVEGLIANDVKLKDFPLEEKVKFTYCYDFGDDWVHQIVIEKIMELGPEFPTCMAGKRNAPPEDSGGSWGYQDLMKKMEANQLSVDEKEWLGAFEPDYFDIEEVNDILSDGETINEDSFY